MQDRYAGDVGDFGKLALLRALATHMRVGVNWYRVSLPGETTGDGRLTGYLDKRQSALYQCDAALAERLHAVVRGERTVEALEKAAPELCCFHALLTRDQPDAWHARAMTALAGCALVFFDPDNGLLVPSVRPTAKKSVKYVLEAEIASAYAAGHSVVFYNHRSRERQDTYRARHAALYENPGLTGAGRLALTYRAYAVRDYVFVVQPGHAQAVGGAVDAFLGSPWQMCFSRFDG